MSKYSKFVKKFESPSEEWHEYYKPSGSLGADGRPAVVYIGPSELGPLEKNIDRQEEERLDVLPILGFGVVRNFDDEEGFEFKGLDENPFAEMCCDGYVSSEKDEANENSVFGCAVVMGED
ncbi:hypothetical protein OCU04_001317 [Sclerotinia nivalis]|uniref:Uncharacterized protein n=1 Tax=Sclerotinia nivalis TaxID=352851 RepID=A0A9X0AXW2_9HELO|nr:hypothetical protein OCU04_001317 [Sclerotinia nivalis]